jgi:hypothetical protein
VDRVYRDADPTAWRSELQKMGFQFVVVGSIEREKYGADVGNKFEGQFPAAHPCGSTVIYSLGPQAVAPDHDQERSPVEEVRERQNADSKGQGHRTMVLGGH